MFTQAHARLKTNVQCNKSLILSVITMVMIFFLLITERVLELRERRYCCRDGGRQNEIRAHVGFPLRDKRRIITLWHELTYDTAWKVSHNIVVVHHNS